MCLTDFRLKSEELRANLEAERLEEVRRREERSAVEASLANSLLSWLVAEGAAHAYHSVLGRCWPLTGFTQAGGDLDSKDLHPQTLQAVRVMTHCGDSCRMLWQPPTSAAGWWGRRRHVQRVPNAVPGERLDAVSATRRKMDPDEIIECVQGIADRFSLSVPEGLKTRANEIQDSYTALPKVLAPGDVIGMERERARLNAERARMKSAPDPNAVLQLERDRARLAK